MTNIPKNEILTPLKFCVFDLETTGGNHKTDKIIEIGLVNIDQLKVTEKKNYLIDPERGIPDFIQRLTGIKEKDVQGAPKIEEVIDEIMEFIGDRILIAHNVSFDVPFLNSVLTRMNREHVPNKSICTNLMTKYLMPTLMNSNLNYMSQIFKIQHKKAHRALDDAEATAKLFLNYLEIYATKGIKKVNHLYYPKGRYELDLAHFKIGAGAEGPLNKIDTLKSPFLISFKGKNGIILFAFPCSGSEAETVYIKEKIKTIEWETISYKLIGPFSEVVIKFNHLYVKLEQELRKEIIEKLWLFNLEKIHRKDLLEQISQMNQADFIVMNHLVPDQYTIYPVGALGHKNELIFRYPGHKKKLIQYISSRASKIASGKVRKIHFPQGLAEFLETYMAAKATRQTEIFYFSKSQPLKRADDFFYNFEKFLTKNPNTYNYPQQYI